MQRNRTILAIIVVAFVVTSGALGIYALINNTDDSQGSSEVQTETFIEESSVNPIDTIISVLAPSETLYSFLNGIQETELSNLLSGEGLYTVFPPLDRAFEELAPSRTDLKNILSYHIVEGSFRSADLTDGRTLTTLQGGTIRVKQEEGFITLVDAIGSTARIISADGSATNGVIHIIDKVMMPE